VLHLEHCPLPAPSHPFKLSMSVPPWEKPCLVSTLINGSSDFSLSFHASLTLRCLPRTADVHTPCLSAEWVFTRLEAPWRCVDPFTA
jgi:hypothetical protein